MPTAFEFLNQQLGLYHEQAEGWQPEHIEAMRCRDIEDSIRYGLFILETIQRQNARWAEDVERGTVPFTWETADHFAQTYHWWLAESTTLSAAIQAFQARGFGVDGAAAFREKLREVSLLPLDIAKVQRSVESLERGEGIPLKQAMDELRCGKG
jgi:hypothetical protein